MHDPHSAVYIPPFRLYFIISVAFFGLASVTTTLSDFTVGKHAMTTADRAELDNELQQPDVPVAVRSTVDEITTARAMTPQLAAQLCGHLGFGWPRVDARLQPVCVRQDDVRVPAVDGPDHAASVSLTRALLRGAPGLLSAPAVG